jgi:hypothetical protein
MRLYTLILALTLFYPAHSRFRFTLVFDGLIRLHSLALHHFSGCRRSDSIEIGLLWIMIDKWNIPPAVVE